MGEIFLAQIGGAHGFDKLCVIKKILPHLAENHDFVSRFIDEAKILVKLSHGNIAQVLDMGVHDGAPYIALEFVDGKDLRRVLAVREERQIELPLSFVLSVGIRLLDALAYAHRKRDDDDHELNIVHRDISPPNVLISYEGEVKVIDFGLAKSALSLAMTQPNVVLGKFKYMAPEQARQRQVDRRSDLYAVGICLWESIAGRNPFDRLPPGDVMLAVATPHIPPLLTVKPDCPPLLSEAVAKALAVDPSLRFQSAEEFRAKLQAVLLDIDPLAGSESTSRFMRETFATEYQAERRLLAALKGQSKTTGAAGTAEGAPAFERPALSPDDATPTDGQLTVDPETLSFQPTPRQLASNESGEVALDEPHTEPNFRQSHTPTPLPSIMVEPSVFEGPLPTQEMARPGPMRTERLQSPSTSRTEPEVLPGRSRSPKTSWAWVALPVTAILGVGGFITYDLTRPLPPEFQVQSTSRLHSQRAGDAAMKALKLDLERVADESLRQSFRLKFDALRTAAGTISDEAFREKAQSLHAEIKEALAQQP